MRQVVTGNIQEKILLKINSSNEKIDKSCVGFKSHGRRDVDVFHSP
jgi:hypothetical protein